MIDWNGPSRQPCPKCGRGPKDRTCGVTLDERGGVAHCHRCEYVETLRNDVGQGRPGTAAARITGRPKHQALSEFGHALWRACRPLAGDALAYLQARCCAIPPADGHLRYHPALQHPPSGIAGPALVALVTDAITGAPLTLHRTWVRADGTKAFDPPRMLLGNHRKAGGVVRLWPDDAVTVSLGVAEGVETALSLAHGFAPVWAALDATNLCALPVLAGVQSLLIGADHDAVGIAAANACAERWSDAGADALVVLPRVPGTDFNDQARAT
jgi:hypothetical protein